MPEPEQLGGTVGKFAVKVVDMFVVKVADMLVVVDMLVARTVDCISVETGIKLLAVKSQVVWVASSYRLEGCTAGWAAVGVRCKPAVTELGLRLHML